MPCLARSVYEMHFLCRCRISASDDNADKNNNQNTVYGAVIMTQSHYESSYGSFNEFRLSVRWLPALFLVSICPDGSGKEAVG